MSSLLVNVSGLYIVGQIVSHQNENIVYPKNKFTDQIYIHQHLILHHTPQSLDNLIKIIEEFASSAPLARKHNKIQYAC